MEELANALNVLVNKVEPLLLSVDANEVSSKPAPEKWSKKEILGHLVDSACNNQQKFVRILLAENKLTNFVGYNQDEWVNIQRYNTQEWRILVALWSNYNCQLAHVIQNTSKDALQKKILIEGQGPFTLEFIMTDYLEHLKHHLKQILPEAGLIKQI